ncbi:hypothetical protein [Maritalea porphyrae]|uniref:hypothetical protein n=1 Tax=Maritalea porphyrae TaxID=880732 RepID=UPI0022AE706E|nr:hypothetical protein [Maritalea porphyrae]MCZ4270753.1 hypothetical protein [Maritalea porphyrae]
MRRKTTNIRRKRSRSVKGKVAAFVGYQKGRGTTSNDISRMLGGRFGAPNIRRMCSRWGLPEDDRNSKVIPVRVSNARAAQLKVLAGRRNMAVEDWAGRVLEVCIKDDMYNAVVDED